MAEAEDVPELVDDELDVLQARSRALAVAALAEDDFARLGARPVTDASDERRAPLGAALAYAFVVGDDEDVGARGRSGAGEANAEPGAVSLTNRKRDGAAPAARVMDADVACGPPPRRGGEARRGSCDGNEEDRCPGRRDERDGEASG